MDSANVTQLILDLQSETQLLRERSDVLQAGVDLAWIVTTAIGILGMQGGFAMLEVGKARMKDSKSVLFKNMLDHSVGALAWFFIGYGIYSGSDPVFAGPGSEQEFAMNNPLNFARAFNAYGFAVTAATVVSGAVQSRLRLSVYVIFSFFGSGITYPILAHSIWNPAGFLAQRGMRDYAGSCVVHQFAGFCALVGAIMVGPRYMRFVEIDDSTGGGSGPADVSQRQGNEFNRTSVDFRLGSRNRRGSEDAGSEAGLMYPRGAGGSEDWNPRGRWIQGYAKLAGVLSCGSPRFYRILLHVVGMGHTTRIRQFPGHNVVMMVLGMFILYVAWFSFNAGSSGPLTSLPVVESAARAALNTAIACGAAATSSYFYCKLFSHTIEMDFIVNASLCGLVAITAPCGYIEPWAALLLGIISAPCVRLASFWVLYGARIDDPLDAFAVHGAGGVLGTIYLGLFHPVEGLFYSGNANFLSVQIYGSIICAAWGIITTFLFFLPFKLCNKLTYTEDEQTIGLDFVYFHGSSYPEFDAHAVVEFNAAKRVENQYHRAPRMASSMNLNALPSPTASSTNATPLASSGSTKAKNGSKGKLDRQGSEDLTTIRDVDELDVENPAWSEAGHRR